MVKGFTLIETVIAIFLLTVGTAGSFALMRQVTSSASITSSQLVASYLAQEGIEIIRNIRDTNYLNKRAWDAGINTGTDYGLDYQSEIFPDETCGDYLQYDSDSYICSVSGKFQRQITIVKSIFNNKGKMVVSVEVSWLERGIRHKVLAETELYDWR